MPSSLDAPQFTGHNLLCFLDDYEMAADNVGWTDEQKCDHIYKYCVWEEKSLIKALRPRKEGDWKGTVEMMKQLYSGKDRTDKYSRDSLERLILQDRTITSKSQFVKYYRDFTKRTHSMYEEVAEDDKNRLFWKGLPKDLQKDIFSELRVLAPGLDRKKAPAVKDVREIAMKIFDKNSLYAPLAISHSKSKEKKSKYSSHKKKKRSKSRTTFEDSDEETDSSSEEDRHRRRRRNYHRKSDSSNSDSSSSDESDDNSSEDEFRRMGDRKRKLLSQQRSKRRNKRSSRNDSDKESDLDKEDDIANLTEKFRRLELMLSQRKDKKEDDYDIPRDARFIKDPTYQYLARALNKVAQEAEAERNNMHLQRDRPLPYNPPRNNKRFQCFVCHQSDTHPRGSMNCPEARALVDQGYCKFIDGRLVMKDDSDMPKTAPFESLGRAIHRLYGNKLPKSNGNLARPSHVAYAEVLEPEEWESNSSDASPAMWNHVYAVERNKKDRKDKPQFDPVNKEKRVRWQDKQDVEQRPKPYIQVPPVPKQWGKAKQPGTSAQARPFHLTNTPKEPSTAPPSQVPPKLLKRPHPENQPVPPQEDPLQIQQAEDRVGTLGRQPNVRKSDFIVQGNPKTPNKGPEKIVPRTPAKTRYISAMRQQFDESQVYKKVLGTNVSIPLGELIAACPKLEKSLASDTRAKTVPITRVQDEDEEMADAFANFTPQNQEEECDYIPDFDPQDQSWQVYNSTVEYEPNQVYAAKKEKEHNKEKVASSTGSFILKVGDTEVRAMVDSGAEINMITPALAEHLRDVYAEDENGRKFQIRNISGTISSLKGRFNNVPVDIGGHRLYETFFVGDEWNSHFQVVLGQAFLQNQACEMSWEENDYINMWFHPNGDKNKAAIKIRLMRRKGVDKKGAVASLAAAELFGSRRKKKKGSFITIDSTNTKATNRHQGTQGVTEILDQEYIEEEEDIMHPSNFPEQDFKYRIGDNTQGPPAKSSLSGSDEEKDEGDSISETDQTPLNSEENDEDWLDVQPGGFQVSALQTSSKDMPGRIFHKAMADFLRILKPASEPASYESAQATYNARVYKAFYQIPIGNRNLSIEEGEQQIRVKNKSMRATFDAKANYNLITKAAQMRSKLKTITAYEKDDNQEAIKYCSNVEINLGQGPALPGLFLIIDDYIPGGYDVVLGKPWMMGIEKKFAKSRFTPEMETLEGTKGNIENTSDSEEEPLIGRQYQSSDEETQYVQKKRGYYTEYADNRPKKRMKEDRLRATNREPCGYMREYDSPDIGGSITRTL